MVDYLCPVVGDCSSHHINTLPLLYHHPPFLSSMLSNLPYFHLYSSLSRLLSPLYSFLLQSPLFSLSSLLSPLPFVLLSSFFPILSFIFPLSSPPLPLSPSLSSSQLSLTYSSFSSLPSLPSLFCYYSRPFPLLALLLSSLFLALLSLLPLPRPLFLIFPFPSLSLPPSRQHTDKRDEKHIPNKRSKTHYNSY